MHNKLLLFQPYYDLKGHFKPFLNVHNKILADNNFECHSVVGRETEVNPSRRNNEYRYNGSTKFLRILSTFIGLRKVRSVCEKNQIDIIHFLDFEIVILCFFLMINRSFFSKRKMVLTLHSVNYLQKNMPGLLRSIYRKLIVYSYQYIDSKFSFDVITNGETITNTFTTEVILKNNRVITSYWGTEKIKPEIELLNKKKNSFLFLGIIRRDKNIEYLLDELSKVDKDFILTIAGMPFDYSINELTTLLRESGIPENRIKTHFDFLNESDYERLLADNKYIILPYKKENKSNSGPLIQALQFNVIPIVSDYGERAQIVKKLDLGYTFRFGDGNGLGSITSQVIDDNGIQTDTYLENIKAKKNSFLWKNIIEELIYRHKIYSI